MYLLLLFISYSFIVFITILLINNNSYIDLIKMFKKTLFSASVNTAGGLGNRLLSFAGIILLSIFYDAKPFCIVL